MKCRNLLASIGVAAFVLAMDCRANGQNFDLVIVNSRADLKIKDRSLTTDVMCGLYTAFSPDKKKLVFAPPQYIAPGNPGEGEEAWKNVAIWDITEKKAIKPLTGHKDTMWHLAYSNDGTKVVGAAHECVSLRLTNTEILIWDAARGELTKRFVLEGSSSGISLAGDVLVTQIERPGRVMVYDLSKDGKKTFSVDVERLAKSALSLDGRLVATLTKKGAVQVWDIASGKEKARFAIPEKSFVYRMSFSGDGKFLCSQASSTRTYCWNVAEKTLVGCFVYDGYALSPDGHYMVGTLGREVALVSLKTRKRVAELEFDDQNWRGMHFVFAPDGSFVAGAGDRKIRIWDLPKDLPD